MTRLIAVLIACELGLSVAMNGQTGTGAAAAQAAPQPAAAPTTTAAPARHADRSQKNQNGGQPKRQFRQQPATGQQQPQVHQQPSGSVQQEGFVSRQQSSNRQRTRRSEVDSNFVRPSINFAQATQRQHHQRHDHGWWKSRYTTIVFVSNCGYYYWDAGYWFPALGYYPQYENFEYNGPIYTYGDLLPDQVIYNVQRALKEFGYYAGQLSGSLSAATRAALSAFQEDNGLDVTGAIDAPTVEALGLY